MIEEYILERRLMVRRLVVPIDWWRDMVAEIPDNLTHEVDKNGSTLSTYMGIGVTTNPWLTKHIAMLDSMGQIVGIINLEEA